MSRRLGATPLLLARLLLSAEVAKESILRGILILEYLLEALVVICCLSVHNLIKATYKGLARLL